MYDVFEDDRIDVLTHQVDEEPITDIGFANDHFNTFALNATVPQP